MDLRISWETKPTTHAHTHAYRGAKSRRARNNDSEVRLWVCLPIRSFRPYPGFPLLLGVDDPTQAVLSGDHRFDVRRVRHGAAVWRRLRSPAGSQQETHRCCRHLWVFQPIHRYSLHKIYFAMIEFLWSNVLSRMRKQAYIFAIIHTSKNINI